MHNSWRTEGRSQQNQGILGTQGAQSITRSGKVCAPIIPRRIKDRATKEGCAKQSSLLKLHPFERPENVVINLCLYMCDELALIDIKRQSYFGPSSMTSFTSAATTLCVPPRVISSRYPRLRLIIIIHKTDVWVRISESLNLSNETNH